MKILVMAVSLLFATMETDRLAGRWETKPSDKGNVFGIVFKNGNSMETYTNKKPFSSGRYFFNAADSVFCFVDNACGQAIGVYKVHFFSNTDSMRFTAILDTCVERRNGIERLIMGRVK